MCKWELDFLILGGNKKHIVVLEIQMKKQLTGILTAAILGSGPINFIEAFKPL